MDIHIRQKGHLYHPPVNVPLKVEMTHPPVLIPIRVIVNSRDRKPALLVHVSGLSPQFHLCITSVKIIGVIIYRGSNFISLCIHEPETAILHDGNGPILPQRARPVILDWYPHVSVGVNQAVSAIQDDHCQTIQEIARKIIGQPNDLTAVPVHVSPFPVL